VSPAARPRAADPLSREGLERELGRRYGTVFAPTRASTLDLAFDRAADAVGAPTLADLLARALRGEAAVLDALVRETSVGETYFFREMEGIARVVDTARRICREAPRPITVWSAGCATGEEAYSLVVLFLETFGPGAGLQVLATDVNAAALERARAASYGAWSFRNVAETRKARWFEPSPEGRPGEQLRPIEEVRSRVHFQTCNLAADDAPDNRWPRGCDLIVCRNVLVYFAPAAVRLVSRRLAAALAPGGELVTASTDPPLVSAALHLAQPVPPVYVGAATAATTAARETRPSRPSKPPRGRISPVPRAPAARSASRRPPGAIATPPLPSSPSTAALAGAASGGADISAARALADEGKYNEAADLLDPLVAAHPLAVEPRVLRGFVHLSRQRAAEALADADAALLLDPSVPLAHVVAAMASLQLGDRDRAQRSARNALGVLGPAADTAEHAELARTCRALLRPSPSPRPNTPRARGRGGAS
jgi:chemotaxis protein methyltransferase CheR